MSTHRVLYNNTRLATAVVTKNGRFLQVHPTKEFFESEAVWKKHWKDDILRRISFTVTEPKPKAKKEVDLKDMSREELVALLLSLRNSAPAPAAKKVVEKPELADIPKPADMLKWEFKENVCNMTFPPGKYYIGDLCYALQDCIYDGVFGKQGYEEGLYSSSLGSFMMHGTGGDGEFPGSDGYKYPVDAGLIGIASLACCNPEKDIYGGKVFEFKEPVKCKFNEEAFVFTSGNFYLRIQNYGDYTDEYEEEGGYETE